jgi:hypothetical protein
MARAQRDDLTPLVPDGYGCPTLEQKPGVMVVTGTDRAVNVDDRDQPEFAA